ncbi:MAG TPA: endonuclease/exonuclease/phosphatase family protein [Tepidisphaeraceae bacterium]|nr:endonuclease/exonuclease/phosphatase family protein [Tepidisphaeraceae bacterium]
MRTFVRLLWLIVLSYTVLLCLSFIYPQNFRNENRWYLLGVSALFLVRLGMFHFGLLSVTAFGIALVLRRQKLAILSLVLGLVCIAPYAWNARSKSPPPAAGKTIRIFTINAFARNREPQKVVEMIRQANPDLIVFVELTGKTAEKILPQIEEDYPHANYATYPSAATIFSRIPFRVEPHAPTNDWNAMRPAIVFELDGREVALYGVHLLSPSRTLKQESSLKLIGTLGFAMKVNRSQIVGIESILQTSKYPCIFAGDFNFPPYTPSFERLTELGLSDAHRMAGTGLGNTWRPIWWKPLAPFARAQLDHVFITNELTITNCEVGPDVGSDHFPVIVDVGWRKLE